MTNIKEQCGYNYKYRYTLPTGSGAVPMKWVDWCNDNCKKRWGWHFIPQSHMNYYSDDWYTAQKAYLTFESKDDCVQAAFELNLQK